MPTTPPALSAILPFPALAERAAGTYNANAYACLNAWAITYGPQLAALAANAYANANDAASSADTATSAAATAVTAASNAAASASFKGNWSSLTGALNTPSSVMHAGVMWALLSNLADVTTQAPVAGSAYWTPLSTVSAASAIFMYQNFGGF